jgi:biofilm PGA synthesis lipoprotein PgaB
VIGVPKLVDQYRSFARHYLHRDALPAPDVRLTAAERARWQPVPEYRGAVPVLAYHGINDHQDHYSISQRNFARHMAMLKAAGFNAISPAQYADFLHGDRERLPERPILITFDDGRLDSYRGADKVLERYGLRATNFIITAIVAEGNPFYSRWDELKKMARSGRWDLQEHTDDGHDQVRIDSERHTGPYYAYRRYLDGHLETFKQYRTRVVRDVLAGKRAMRKHIPGFRASAFAVPFGSYGQWEDSTNDRRIPRFFLRFLRRHFAAVFVQSPDARVRGRTERGDVERFEIHTRTTADQLYAWLHAHLLAARQQAIKLGEQAPVGPLDGEWLRLESLARLRRAGYRCVKDRHRKTRKEVKRDVRHRRLRR